MLEIKVAQEVASLLGEKVGAIKGLLAMQREACVCDYQIGLYNGLVLALSVLTGKEPEFYEQEGGNENGISN